MALVRYPLQCYDAVQVKTCRLIYVSFQAIVEVVLRVSTEVVSPREVVVVVVVEVVAKVAEVVAKVAEVSVKIVYRWLCYRIDLA